MKFKIILFLFGEDKKTQNRDIKKAEEYFGKDWFLNKVNEEQEKLCQTIMNQK